MKNLQIAQIFRSIAEILEIKGENPFRIRAYQKAAQNLESLTEDIEKIAQENALEKIPGIGKDLSEKIKEIIKTGTLKQYEELKKEIPKGLVDLLSVPSIGPKTAKLLYEKLNIKSIKELEEKAKRGLLHNLPGIREKTEENILKGIVLLYKGQERLLLPTALNVAEGIISSLKKLKEVQQINYAGSLRRMKETIRDIDILVTSTNPEKIIKTFVNLPQVLRILAEGKTKSSILTRDNVQADVRVVEPGSYSAALLYFTGSKNHNISLRELANRQGYTINEYGLFKQKKKNVTVASRTEEELYQKLNLQYIPPELREDRGEIEAAGKNKLPDLIEPEDIKGDIHIHSNWSDGSATIEQIAQSALKKNWPWVAICDHSQTLKVAGGMSTAEVYRKIEQIRKFNKNNKNIRLLCGMEVDILSDGKLDYPDGVLKELDVVIAAIHSGFKQSEEQITQRIIKAMGNRYVQIIAHPTGRLLNKRDPYKVNMEKLLEFSIDTKTILEINAFPERLDLTDIYCKKAKEMGIKLIIGTDAHILDQLDYMTLGVAVARRGWLEKKDILNTLSVDNLIKELNIKRK